MCDAEMSINAHVDFPQFKLIAESEH